MSALTSPLVSVPPLPPGSTIGVIGGGQLGRMLCMAAAQLGYPTHIYAPEASGPAADVCAKWVQGSYGDEVALLAFARSVAVITFEFENIEPAALKPAAAQTPLFPPLHALEIGQDRILEKRFAEQCGARTAPWAEVHSHADYVAALATIGVPAILKTVRFGYDGKGQARIMKATDADAAWDGLKRGCPLILEGFVPFKAEFSLIVARDQAGSIAFWDAPQNIHKDGVLTTSLLPTPQCVVSQVPAARASARKIAEKLDYVGVFAIEFFVGLDGPVFNEMAPRVHNSGHWTIEGAVTSQFENHVRAIVGLPLGGTKSTARAIEMRNLIGHDADDWHQIASDPNAKLHLYGKHDARPGRKMGHVTQVKY
jgi:5-(carboxyamino)imidazole ribonucleotide synthase